jgi:hypothetical protein
MFILQKRGKVKEVELTTETPYPKKKEIKPKNPQNFFQSFAVFSIE